MAWAEIIPPELLEKLFVAMHDANAAPHLGL
jgi:hypothetical protein